VQFQNFHLLKREKDEVTRKPMLGLEKIGCATEAAASDEVLNLIGLGVEKWRNGEGRSQEDTSVILNDVEGNTYGIPTIGTNERYNISKHDNCSQKHVVLWDIQGRTFRSSDRVQVAGIEPNSKYAPFVKVEQLSPLYISNIGQDGCISGTPETECWQIGGMPSRGVAEKGLWFSMLDYLTSALTASEKIISGRKLDCKLVVPMLKLTQIISNVNKDTCLYCPFYAKAVITGYTLRFTIFRPPLTRFDASCFDGTNYTVLDKAKENLRIVIEENARTKAFRMAGFEPQDLESTLRFLEQWITHARGLPADRMEAIFIEAESTNFIRSSYLALSGHKKGQDTKNPYWCPVCKNQVMIPYQQRYMEELDAEKPEEWPRIFQVDNDPTKAVIQRNRDENSEVILPPLPLFEPHGYVDGKRTLYYCPIFCCAALCRDQALNEEHNHAICFDEKPLDSPLYTKQIHKQIGWTIELSLIYRGDDMNCNIRRNWICDELAYRLQMSTKQIFIHEARCVDEKTGETFDNDNIPEYSEEDPKHRLAIHQRLTLLTLPAAQALYGKGIVEDPMDLTLSRSDDDLKKLDQEAARMLGDILTPSTAGELNELLAKDPDSTSPLYEAKLFGDVDTVRLSPENEALEQTLRCREDCPLGCGTSLPRWDKKTQELHSKWICPVTVTMPREKKKARSPKQPTTKSKPKISDVCKRRDSRVGMLPPPMIDNLDNN